MQQKKRQKKSQMQLHKKTPINKKADKSEPLVKQAIALHYNEKENNPVPEVTATGKDEVALNIIALAKEHGIPIHEDPDLAVLLSQLELYQDIPEALYQVIAEVLAFAYIVSGKTPRGFEPDS